MVFHVYIDQIDITIFDYDTFCIRDQMPADFKKLQLSLSHDNSPVLRSTHVLASSISFSIPSFFIIIQLLRIMRSLHVCMLQP